MVAYCPWCGEPRSLEAHSAKGDLFWGTCHMARCQGGFRRNEVVTDEEGWVQKPWDKVGHYIYSRKLRHGERKDGSN